MIITKLQVAPVELDVSSQSSQSSSSCRASRVRRVEPVSRVEFEPKFDIFINMTSTFHSPEGATVIFVKLNNLLLFIYDDNMRFGFNFINLNFFPHLQFPNRNFSRKMNRNM